ncbi:MAG TPA: two-component regulator propeller domain-containing protein [Vicinamibacterales bacterium]|nr:two-component regulator propeller domain-containing protein [Vicinamibacterales bacterium]
MRERTRPVVLRAAVALAMLTWCSRSFASNPTPDVSQYAHTEWTVAEGFAKGAIYSIAQTPDGYLWLGTEFGVLRFDGVRTTPWESDRLLPSSKIASLLAGRDGTLWIGTSKGLASWKNGKLTVYAEFAGQITDRLLEDRSGAIWLRALTPPTGKLCAIRNGSVRCWGEDGRFGARITTMYEDRKGQLWFGEPHGVWQWNQSAPRFYPVGTDKFVQALDEDADGVLLVLLSGTIQRLVDGTLREVYRLPGASGQLTTVVEALRDRDGTLWLGALGGGLTHLHDRRIDQFSQSDGLSSDSVAGLFQDREGNIWVATHGGLDRFRALPVTPFTLQQGLSSLRVLSVVASTDGSIWLRTATGVDHWADGHVTTYRESPDLSSGSQARVTPADEDTVNSLALSGGALFQDVGGRVWVSTVRSIGYFDHGRFHVVPSVPGGRVHAITGDRDGDLWVAHETRGLLHVAGERLVDQVSWARLGHADYADALVVDPSTGGLWLGFFAGRIEFVKDGEVRASYGPAEGLAPGRVNDFRFGRDGALWAAGEGGLSRLKNGHIVTLSSRGGLPCDAAHWTMEDDGGDFWVSMPCGLVRIARAELEAWVSRAGAKQPEPRTVAVTVFGSSDGVRSRANAGPFSPHVAKAIDGRIWFFPLEGLSVMDPRHMSFNSMLPPVNVEQITADRVSYDPSSAVSGRVRLPPLVRDLQIDYTALSFVAPEKIRFRYKLEGLDGDWQDAANRRQAFYTNLRPGAYRFRVMASNNSGVWNEAGASVDFAIAPAYYQTPWFLALSVVSVLAMIWTGHRVRLRIVEKHQREISALNERLMKAQEQERMRIAGELHDGVMQEMLAVTMMLGTAKRRIPGDSPAKATIDTAQEKMIRVGMDLRQLSHGLHPPLLQEAGLPRAVEGYCEQFSASTGVPVSCDCDDGARELSPGAALTLFRVLQEALGNAAKYATATRVTVRLTKFDSQVSMAISDNGVGFDPGRLGTSPGLGLIMMRERASQLHGRFELESAPGRGTSVRIVIPFR